MVTAGLLRPVGSAGCTCTSMRRNSAPATRRTAPTVFSCVPLGINAAGPRGAKGRVYPKNKGSLYPKQLVALPHLHSAVRRTARAGATPGVGLQRRGARFRPRWLRPVSFTLVGSGSDVREERQPSTRERRVAGLPRGRRPARATLRVARATPRSPPCLSGSSSARPHAPLMRRSRRGRRFCESRYSLLAQNPAKSKAQSSPQFSALVRLTAAPLSLL